ncbi:hypothetical protein BDQ17DRAFT_1366506 [Cyathus striatus]|nr:hypothetical protein BDQ17DRAFT_1366506 [Cyathus striatus]
MCCYDTSWIRHARPHDSGAWEGEMICTCCFLASRHYGNRRDLLDLFNSLLAHLRNSAIFPLAIRRCLTSSTHAIRYLSWAFGNPDEMRRMWARCSGEDVEYGASSTITITQRYSMTSAGIRCPITRSSSDTTIVSPPFRHLPPPSRGHFVCYDASRIRHAKPQGYWSLG